MSVNTMLFSLMLVVLLSFTYTSPITNNLPSSNSINYNASSNTSSSCETCQFLGDEVKLFLDKTHHTVEEMVDWMLHLCHKLPFFLSGNCENVVKLYGHYYFDPLVKEGGSKIVCTELGLCK